MSNINCVHYVNDNLSLHPVINYIQQLDQKGCYTLPYLDEDNNILFFKSLEQKQRKESKDSNDIKEINYFGMPINSNNFLDIIFNINSINKLDNWLNESKKSDLFIINEVLDLFWIKYYMIFDENFMSAVKLNKTIIFEILHMKKNKNEINIITEDFIHKNYNKKINYLNEIKKYIQ